MFHVIQSSNGSNSAKLFYSSIIDLQKNSDQIWLGIRKSFAYEIRRARDKDHVRCFSITNVSLEDIDKFCKFYQKFAINKNIVGCNRGKMMALADAGVLVLAGALHPNDDDVWLSAHAYICDGFRARLLYSGGNVDINLKDLRQLIGRANKFLHWSMIERFKYSGYREYDFGGISKSFALKQIDEFKEGFGGVESKEFNSIRGVSMIGKVAVSLFRLVSFAKVIWRNSWRIQV